MGKSPVREVLAENVNALRAIAGNPSSQAAIAEAAGIDQTTVGRMLRKTHSISVDALGGLAKALKCTPWQLLLPNLEAKRAVTLSGLSPKALEVALLYDALPERRQRLIYAQIQDMHNPDVDPADEFSALSALPDVQPSAEPGRAR